MWKLTATVVAIGLAGYCDSVAADERSWENGSTAVQREQAHQLFSKGNDHFFKREYAKALALYEQALAVFDHPRIRLAMAEVLVFLGRAQEASVHLEAAMRWDRAPFDDEEYARARDLKETLAHQLGTLVVGCATPGLQVTLDGKDTSCGERMSIGLGKHQIVARKRGYLTATEGVVIEAGKETAITLRLKTLDEGARFERRWPVWKPWTTVGVGGGIALLGLPLAVLARANMSEFRTQVSSTCGTDGCPAGHPVFEYESRANLQNTVAISMWAVGGAVAVTGLVMVYLNREHRVSVAPVASRDGVGVAAGGSF